MDTHKLVSLGSFPRRKTRTRLCFHPDYSTNLRKLLHPILEIGGTVYIEDIFCRSRKGFKALSIVLGEVGYEVRAVYGEENRMKTVLPTLWQSRIGKDLGVPFKRLQSKDCARLCAIKILGFAPESQHEVDAICIAYYGVLMQRYQLLLAKAESL